MFNEDSITTILKGICDFYVEKFGKKIPKTWIKKIDMTDPYSVNDFLLDLDEKTNYDGSTEIEYFIDDIFRYLGYDKIEVNFSRVEELDWENEWVIRQSYFSYITGKNYDGKENNCAGTPLSFVKIYGCTDPIEIISFIINTIAAYEVQKITFKAFNK